MNALHHNCFFASFFIEHEKSDQIGFSLTITSVQIFNLIPLDEIPSGLDILCSHDPIKDESPYMIMSHINKSKIPITDLYDLSIVTWLSLQIVIVYIGLFHIDVSTNIFLSRSPSFLTNEREMNSFQCVMRYTCQPFGFLSNCTFYQSEDPSYDRCPILQRRIPWGITVTFQVQ